MADISNFNEHSCKRKVILVTDGDRIARKAVEAAASNIGARCISKSAGNPTPLTGGAMINFIMKAPYDPVVVMVDDRGHTGQGKGEQAICTIANCPNIEILGVVAVASNTEGVKGVEVDASITKNGNIIEKAVDKCGNLKEGHVVYGDTVDVLSIVKTKVVIGIGDPGKMQGKDKCEIGAPIMTKALKEIMKRSGYA